MITKRCTRCGKVKPATTEFYPSPGRKPRRGGPVGFAAWCRQCYRDKTKAWNAEHLTPARAKAWAANVKAKKARIKDAVFGAYGGYVCRCCGETEPSFLIIDHVNNDGAVWRRATFGTRLATGWKTYQWLFKHGFPPGYQVLCMNCNFGKRINGGVCPHQTRRNDYPLEGVGSSEPKRTTVSDDVFH